MLRSVVQSGVEATTFFFCVLTFYSALLTPFLPHFCFMPALFIYSTRIFIFFCTPFYFP